MKMIKTLDNIRIVKTKILTFHHNGNEFKSILVKLDDGKWYKAIKTINGYFMLKENKKDEKYNLDFI